MRRRPREWWTRDGWMEWRAARRYQRRQERALKLFVSSGRYRQIKACRHVNREPNPNATALPKDRYRAERCLDCGIGVVTFADGGVVR